MSPDSSKKGLQMASTAQTPARKTEKEARQDMSAFIDRVIGAIEEADGDGKEENRERRAATSNVTTRAKRRRSA